MAFYSTYLSLPKRNGTMVRVTMLMLTAYAVRDTGHEALR